MSSQFGFDIRKSVAGANAMRMIVVSLFSIGLILWGSYLVPPDFARWFELSELEKWTLGGFFGVFMIITGALNLLKLLDFFIKSIGSWGEWHFRLSHDQLIWDVPDHAHGPEIGFRVKLSDIKEVEFRTVHEFEEHSKREYWIHFWERESIELKSYTSLSLSWLVSKIAEAGVPYNETNVSK